VIKITGDKLKGFNTDSDAFYDSIEKWYPATEDSKAMILGTGGSSKAVRVALRKLKIPFLMVSREKSLADLDYEMLQSQPELYKECNLIINTTPLGMSPNTESCPAIDHEQLTPKHFVYDLIYNPARTQFLQKAEMRGATIKNGLEMLHIQAEKSWEIWNN
jgi:shikimate dehydrogenase